LPTWVFKGNTSNGKEYLIMPSTNITDTTIRLTKTENEKNESGF